MAGFSLVVAALLAASPTPAVEGVLDHAEIAKVIKASAMRIRRCYEEALKVKPELNGKVSVKFVIAPTGQVQSAAMAEDSMHEPMVSDCVIAIFRRLVFPAPSGNGAVTVSYPFAFKRSGP